MAFELTRSIEKRILLLEFMKHLLYSSVFYCTSLIGVSWYSLSSKISSLLACCNRQSVGCATYAMVTNILTFIFSAVLINFDRRVINPDESSGSYVYGNSFRIDCVSASSSKSNDQTDWGNIMLGLTKGQLAGGVLMLVSALTFIGIYVYVYIRALQHDGRMPSSFVTGPSRAPPAPQSATYQVPYSGPSKNTVSLGGGSRVIVCPNCGPIAEESGRF